MTPITNETNPPTDDVPRRALLRAGALTGALLLVPVGTATAYDFPSTNADNEANGDPFVDVASQDNCEIALEFTNPHGYLACFEVRVDGQTRTSGTEHPVVDGDYIYENYCVTDGTRTETFEATQQVDVRLALGAERDHDFDWVSFGIDACEPESRADCKGGGWKTYGFRNQGQCIRYVNTGKDSR
ncbi:hypothetical protein [Natronosalvus rutilus]|uniref:Uncharacterized protein n=1 Tax=Natronosalvus rutilus TaxID=2953753 RepID=A0A9E7SV15_9EURY|nr:hypothetical protein [Natronosalvus rutilus]UTF55389.1 hypothetical protein NGM29_09115 [Natronosalvus rutilus]